MIWVIGIIIYLLGVAASLALSYFGFKWFKGKSRYTRITIESALETSAELCFFSWLAMFFMAIVITARLVTEAGKKRAKDE